MKSIRKVKANIDRYRSRKNPVLHLPFPVSPTLRLAQVSAGPRFAEVPTTILKHWQDLPQFAPNVLVGSASELLRLAEKSMNGTLDTSSIDHALLVTTHYGMRPLTDVMRVRLWQAFGVPIFELYLGLDNGLLASECEAHEGWHLAAGVDSSFIDGQMVMDGAGNMGLRAGFSAFRDPNPCPCGHESARILHLETVARYPELRYLAASA